ncbi:hypothetical protein GCM10009779_06940 [Polymorphospora rubra]|uniref:Uncharacterized protein n=1 Tax=Polymorphospora rubra TaxID=338584 RepID=A0A810N9C6_9ACTN|nr:hypothetical protein Prubr_68680 [Polymorphospora rubra]
MTERGEGSGQLWLKRGTPERGGGGAVPDSYPQLLRRLAEVTARVDGQRAEAQQWYERQCAAADRAVRAAQDEVEQARAEVERARQEAQETESRAMVLWQELRERLGPAAARLAAGAPAPARSGGGDPQTQLRRVRDLLEVARQHRELPRSTYPLLAILGVFGAAAAYALGLAARAAGAGYGGDVAVGMPFLALVLTLLGPLVGLAPARVVADRRHASLDVRAGLVVVVAGAVTTLMLLVALR